MKYKYLAVCPECGYKLAMGLSDFVIELNCPKCNRYLHIEADQEGVRTRFIEKNVSATKQSAPKSTVKSNTICRRA